MPQSLLARLRRGRQELQELARCIGQGDQGQRDLGILGLRWV